MKAERVDANIYRIVDGDRVVALAMKLADGRWGAYSTDGSTYLTRRRFDKPKNVRDYVAGVE